MSNRTELEIVIKTVADTRGLQMTEDQLKKLAGAMTQTQTATGGLAGAGKESGKALADLNRAGAGASQVLNGLQQAAQGGIQGIFGLAQATRGFITVARTAVASSGPIGILITVLGLAAGAFLALRGRTKETGEEFDKTKGKVDGANKSLEATTAKAGEAEKALKELAEKGLAEASAEAKQVEDRFNKAAEAIKRMAEAASKVRAAEKNLELAKIDAAEAKGTLSKDQADAARFTINREGARGDLKAQQELAASLSTNEQGRIDAAKGNVSRAMRDSLSLSEDQNKLLGERGAVNDQAGQVRDQARVALEKREGEIAALRKERDNFVPTGQASIDRVTREGLDQKIAAAEAGRDKEQAGFAKRVTPLAQKRDEIDTQLAGLEQGLSQANAALQAFQDALTKTTAAAEEKQSEIKTDIQTTTKVSELNEQANDLRRPAPNAAAPATRPTGTPVDSSRLVDLRRTAEVAQAEGRFGDQAAAVAELKKLNTANKSFTSAVVDSARGMAADLKKAETKMKLAQQAGLGGGG